MSFVQQLSIVARVAFLCVVSGLFAFPLRGRDSTWYRYFSQPSPNGQATATVRIDVQFQTPEGANSCLLINSEPVYPLGCGKGKETYEGIHSFYQPLVWSADSKKVAFAEKIFNWTYYDPFGGYFDGDESHVRYFLVVAGSNGSVAGYPIHSFSKNDLLHWLSDSRLMLGDQMFDLHSSPPQAIR